MLKIDVTYLIRFNGSTPKQVQIKADYLSPNRILQLTAEKLNTDERNLEIKEWTAA